VLGLPFLTGAGGGCPVAARLPVRRLPLLPRLGVPGVRLSAGGLRPQQHRRRAPPPVGAGVQQLQDQPALATGRRGAALGGHAARLGRHGGLQQRQRARAVLPGGDEPVGSRRQAAPGRTRPRRRLVPGLPLPPGAVAVSAAGACLRVRYLHPRPQGRVQGVRQRWQVVFLLIL